MLRLALAVVLAGCSCGAPIAGEDAGPDEGDAQIDAGRDAGRMDGGDPGECPLTDVCDAPLPDLGDTEGWRHSVSTGFTVGMGSPRHRGRDLYLRESDPQWAIGKFAYGAADDDLSDEDVDVYVLRNCQGPWELLGTATTTDDDNPPHETIEGVPDTGGRVYFEIPAADRLGLGRHHVLFVVRGDHSLAHAYLEVLEPDARFVVTDMDGTQTESENAEAEAIFTGADPAHQPSGPELMTAFARRGYHVFYLTARPEWLHTRTHEWIVDHGYPPGHVRTTVTVTPATGDTAATFKTEELEDLLARFPGSIEVAFGNTATDMTAYTSIGLAMNRIVSYRFDPGPGATRVDDYSTLLPFAAMFPLQCN